MKCHQKPALLSPKVEGVGLGWFEVTTSSINLLVSWIPDWNQKLCILLTKPYLTASELLAQNIRHILDLCPIPTENIPGTLSQKSRYLKHDRGQAVWGARL